MKAIEDIYELSPSQRGMFLHSLYGGRAERHLQHLSCTFEGELDPAAFERAWQEMVDRHPILRTSFHADGAGKPLQVVHRRVRLPLLQEDWRGLDAGEQSARLAAFIRWDQAQGFELGRPPLMRLALLRAAEHRHFFLWSRHHLLLDGWSLTLLLQEVFACYDGFRSGREVRLPEPRPVRDYVLWLQGQNPAAAEGFWRQELAGLRRPTPLGLPERRPAPLDGEGGYGEADLLLSAPATAALQGLARQQRLTLNTLVEGAWALLLAHYTGQEEVLFGVTVSGRPTSLAGAERMVGMFINTLPLRVQVPAGASLLPWLAGLQERRAGLHAFEHYSAAEVQEWSEMPKGLPLFESILVFENFPTVGTAEGRLPGGVEVSDYRFLGARTDYPLAVVVLPGKRLTLRFIHDSRRFEPAAVARMQEHLRAALEGFAADPSRPLAACQFAAGEILHRVTAGPRPDAPATAPCTPLERRLAAIWGGLLGRGEVDVHTPFFDLGGHSLLAVRIAARVREELGLELPLRLLAEAPTVAGLAAALEREQAGGQAAAAPAALPRIQPAPARRHEPFDLTDVQHAYWVGRSGAFQLGEVATHSYLELEVLDLDPARLEHALDRLIQRHDMLRAIVLPTGRQQVLAQVPPYRVEVLDLRGQEEDAAAAGLQEVRDRMSHQVLPAERWPIFEVRASRLDEHRYRLHVSTDALIRDAWSSRILAADLLAFYRDPAALVPALDLSFRDCVEAEAALAGSELRRRSVDYWRRRLPELPPAPELPLARDPGALSRPRFTRRRLRLEPGAWKRLETAAAQRGLTSSCALLAAFSEVLAAWSKSRRFTLNLTLFNRLPLHPQIDEVVGDFTSLNLLEVDATVPAPFADRARSIQARLWEDLDHRAMGGVEVLRELARLHWGQRTGMPIVFTSTLGLARAEQDASLGEEVYSISQTPQVLLDHQVGEREGALIVNWDAVEEAFPPGLLDDMFAAFQGLLARLAEGAEAWRAEQHGLLPDHQRALLAAANSTAWPVPEGLLHTPFMAQATRWPERPAVISARRTLTYGELLTLSRQVGRLVRQAGAGPDRLVAVVMEPGWEQAVAVLGILTGGAAYLPVDPDLPPARRQQLLERGEVTLALTQPWLEGRLKWPEGVRRLSVEPAALAGVDDAPLPAVEGSEDLAYVLFTSGSTGMPKGVMIDHRGALNTICDIDERFAVGPGDRVLAVSSLSFDLSVYDLFGTLAAGAAMVLPDAARWRDPEHWRALVVAERVTVWSSVPALLGMLVDHVEQRGGELPGSLRLALLSGDWIPLSLPGRLRALSPGVRVISLGGATEASIWSILHPIERIDPAWVSIPYGRPMRNQTFHVLAEDLEPRPVWVPGQLYIGGIGLARGYWRDEERTRASFLVHPVTGERLYRTGDLGRYLPDGEIEFLGREDFQVKVQGYRIELGEIEAALGEHPQVRAAVVAALGEPRGGKRLVGYVVPHAGGAPATDELRAFLRQRLPEHMVPPVFVALESLPLSVNGKVDRGALPAPEQESRRERPFTAARNPVEQAVAAAWAEVLGLPAHRVGIHDTFFELGGDSLLATRMLAGVREAFRADISLRSFLEAPTVADLALLLEERGGDDGLGQVADLIAQIGELAPHQVEAMLAALETEEGVR